MENTGLFLSKNIESLLDELDRVGPPTGLDGAYTPEQTEQLTEIVRELYESGVILRHWFLGDVEEHDHVQDAPPVLSTEPVISTSPVPENPEPEERGQAVEDQESDPVVEEAASTEETTEEVEAAASMEEQEPEAEEKQAAAASPIEEPALKSEIQQEEQEEVKEAPSTPTPKAPLLDEMRSFGVGEGSEESLNERLSRQATTRRSIASNIRRPISNLKTAIGINDRFLFINSLFQGNPAVFDRALDELNYLTSFEEAQRFVDFEFRERYKWDMEDPTVVDFMNYVHRRYL